MSRFKLTAYFVRLPIFRVSDRIVFSFTSMMVSSNISSLLAGENGCIHRGILATCFIRIRFEYKLPSSKMRRSITSSPRTCFLWRKTIIKYCRRKHIFLHKYKIFTFLYCKINMFIRAYKQDEVTDGCIVSVKATWHSKHTSPLPKIKRRNRQSQSNFCKNTNVES